MSREPIDHELKQAAQKVCRSLNELSDGEEMVSFLVDDWVGVTYKLRDPKTKELLNIFPFTREQVLTGKATHIIYDAYRAYHDNKNPIQE